MFDGAISNSSILEPPLTFDEEVAVHEAPELPSPLKSPRSILPSLIGDKLFGNLEKVDDPSLNVLI